MSLLSRSQESEASGYEALQIDDALAATLTGSAPSEALTVRPDKSNGGIEAMSEVLESLHTVDTESPRLRRTTRNVSPAHFFEMRYAAPRPDAERVVTLQYHPGEGMAGTFRRQLQTRYPESQLETTVPQFLHAEAGQYVAGGTLGLRRYTLLPIKNIDLPGFRSDPTGSILQEMVGAQRDGVADADAVVQVGFKPAKRDWTQGVPNGHGPADSDDPAVNGVPSLTDLSRNLQQPTYEKRWRLFRRETIKIPPSTVDKKVAKLLEDQQGSKGWRLCLRVFALSDDPDVAVARAAKVAGQFRNFYESASEQTFRSEPLSRRGLRATLTRASRREYTDSGIVKSHREVAGLVNIPEAQFVNTNKLQWGLATPGDGIPPGTARFDFGAHGIDAAADREQKQVAMLDAAGPGEPLWYGTGVKHGTEAGVFQDSLYHQFIGGATRQGKTTLLTNYAAQCYRGDGGGLVIDPKGLDAEAFLAEWPHDRSAEDLVVMDLRDEFDELPRFNFLEIPSYLEPGTRAHTSYVEALAEDILAMVAEAGGSDKYLGALMKRVVKAVVRGLAKSGDTATLLDVAAVCASSQNLSQFKDQMADERFQFLRETAERLEARDDTDLEPLAGRMDEWVLNDNVRELICARDSSFSINDVVENGKWLVVRFAPASSETEVKMVGTALIRRTYFAQRHLTPDHPFDLVCDEFDKIASEESNIQSILSEAAAFNYRCTLACQAPTNQLPERVRHAIENQCGTFLSFNPGGGKDAKWIAHQHTVDAEDLLNLPRYKFYMRATTRDDDLTHSYMVEGFPPAREARGDGRTDRDIRALTEASLDHYGAPIETEAEQRAASPFIGGGGETETDSLEMDEQRERQAVAAVYDTMLRTDQEAVTVEATLPALRRRLDDFDGDTVDAHQQVYQHVRDDWLAFDGDHLRATNPRQAIAHIGENRSAGGAGHASLLFDAYKPLTRLFDVTISAASGTDPDATATPIPDPADPELAEELLVDADELRIEAECSTTTKPGSLITHLNDAHDDGHATTVLVRPDDADTVRETVFEDAPGYRSDHDADGERRLYTSPRDLRIGDETFGIPGGESVWIETADGEYILRDDDGVEWAQFESADAIFSDADEYPSISHGETVVKRPVVSSYDTEDVTLVVVPEDAERVADLGIGGEADIPDRAEPLYEILCAQTDPGDTITKGDAVDLAEAHGLDRHYTTIYEYVSELEDAGVLIPRGKTDGGAVTLAVR